MLHPDEDHTQEAEPQPQALPTRSRRSRGPKASKLLSVSHDKTVLMLPAPTQHDLRTEQSEVAVESSGQNTSDVFTTTCDEIRHRVAAAEAYLLKEQFAIADLLVKAKTAYAHLTGVGHGKRNPARVLTFEEAVAERVGRHPETVRKWMRFADLDPETRKLIEARSDVSLRMVLDLVRATDITQRIDAITALDQGGYPAFSAVMKRKTGEQLRKRAKTDRYLRQTLSYFTNPKAKHGQLDPSEPVPEDVVQRHPELAHFDNVGELRRALAKHGGHLDDARAQAVRDFVDANPSLATALPYYISSASMEKRSDDQPALPLFGSEAGDLLDFRTMGELRAAIREAGFAAKNEETERERRGLGVKTAIVRVTIGKREPVQLEKRRVSVAAYRVRVTRASLEAALARMPEGHQDANALIELPEGIVDVVVS